MGTNVPEVGTKVYPEWITNESEERLHDDFRAFLWLVWKHLGLPAPTVRQLFMALYLQNGPRRRMIQAFRGIGKTWITCAYALWRLYRNPNERIKIVSANEDKAVENATFIRRLIEEMPQLHFLRPRGNARDSVMAFDVGPADASVTPSVSCLGITGQLTGGRATIVIPDDIEVPKNSWTEGMRERLAELVKEFDALVVPEGFDIIYLGTPQTEQSVYNHVRKRGYDCRIWPALYPDEKQQRSYGGSLAPDIIADLQRDPKLVGTSTDAVRFNDLDLAERRGSYGNSGFSLQFMLDTSLSDSERYPLKTADLIVMDVARDKAPVSVEYTSDPRNAISDLANVGFAGDRYFRPLWISDGRTDWQGKVIIIDPSGRGADETAYAVLYHAYGTIFLMACGGFRSGYEDATLRGLTQIAKDYAVNLIKIESQYGDGMFTKLLEPYLSRIDESTKKPFYPCSIEEYKVTGQKELRIIDDMEPVLNQHRLVVDRRVVLDDLQAEQKYSFAYQLTHITKDRGALRHDDRLEVVAAGCRHFRERLAVDSKKAEQIHTDKLRDEELRKFMAQAGRTVPKPNYNNGPSVLRKKQGRPARR